ncbi:MAG: TIGR03936 family radical SAM-associated protein [Actinomycetales bacterium]|nr:TIGR03936 family radical SAM-associated protein [Actinomycetales bacterium]
MSRQAPDRDVAPTVQRLRLRYAKRGRLRFSSHRDFQRAFERALRRAGVPIAFSAGFSPHPKVSYANAAPTGSASEAEYLEIGLQAACDPHRLRQALDDALPPGLDVIEVVVARTPDFVARLQASVWRIELPEVDVAAASAAARALLEADEVVVERLTKQGRRSFDARGAVLSLDVAPAGEDPGGCAILTAVVRHGTPTVRPDDVLAALRRVADLVPPAPPRVTRLAQGPLDPGQRTVGDPFAEDRA